MPRVVVALCLCFGRCGVHGRRHRRTRHAHVPRLRGLRMVRLERWNSRLRCLGRVASIGVSRLNVPSRLRY
jgi:hypothetical protein